MVIKKALSLLLSVTSLSLFAGFNNCFSMVPDNYSVTEVTIPGFVNCPNCGATRKSNLKILPRVRHTTIQYTTSCPGCGSYSVKGQKKRRTVAEEPNNVYSCYCGCRRFGHQGRSSITGEQKYRCSNCRKTEFSSKLFHETTNQIWKREFCECGKSDGFVTGLLIAGVKNPITGVRISKPDKVKSILSSPNGFNYYCYTCKKWKHITLNREKARYVCAEYDRCLLEKSRYKE